MLLGLWATLHVQIALQYQGGGDFIHRVLPVLAAHAAFDQGHLSGLGGEPLVDVFYLQALLFKLSAEIPRLLRLRAHGTIHVQRQACHNIRYIQLLRKR